MNNKNIAVREICKNLSLEDINFNIKFLAIFLVILLIPAIWALTLPTWSSSVTYEESWFSLLIVSGLFFTLAKRVFEMLRNNWEAKKETFSMRERMETAVMRKQSDWEYILAMILGKIELAHILSITIRIRQI